MALHVECAQLLASSHKLEEAITRVTEKRRKQPWRYLACTPHLPVLQAERESILDSLDSINTRLKNHQIEEVHCMKQYAKNSCRHLCDMVMDRLPRELRDVIYGYLLPRTTVDATAQWARSYVYLSTSTGIKMNTCDYYWQLQFGTHPIPAHCVDKHHMGRTLLEIACVWDQLTKYEAEVQQLPSLLRSEHWLHGRGAGTAIRNLSVTLWYPKHLRYNWDTLQPCIDANSILELFPLMNICLEVLLGLKPGAKVSVLLTMRPTMAIPRHPPDAEIRERALLECIAPIIHTLRKLQDYGLKVEVTLSDYDWRLSQIDEQVSKELWRARIQENNTREDMLFPIVP
ncbi:hypothetical protein CC86DRAFT_418872 [Ophiobolus disseminans]|uniref:Uncharacterized protein n=1 Tax=Ophiobolus disseminans TaxID=1469910 RepID=A0A6A6ZVN5_9PLEO|nr:hypothetical protein CC86DRAFT_418872 [Ophiobolus disseminans]